MIDFLLANDDLLTSNNLLVYILRWIGWLIIRALAAVIGFAESLLDYAYGMVGWFSKPEFQAFQAQFRPVYLSLLALSLLWLAYKLIFDRKFDKGQVITNAAVMIAVLCLLPAFMVQLSEITSAAVGSIYTQGDSDTSIANSLMKSTVVDISLLDTVGLDRDSLAANNNIPEKDIFRIDPGEMIDPDDTQNKDFYGNKLKFNSDGTYTLTKIGDGKFLGIGSEIFSNRYYRYHIDFSLILAFAAIAIAYIFTAIKVFRLCYELVTHQLLATLTSLNLSSNTKVKHCISSILSTFFVIILTALLIDIYRITVEVAVQDSNIIHQIFVIVVASLCLIDGPNLAERLFGIDAGLTSGFRTVGSLFMASKAIGGMARSAGRFAGKVASGISHGVSAAGGAMAMAGGAMAGFSAGHKKGIYDRMAEQQGGHKHSGVMPKASGELKSGSKNLLGAPSNPDSPGGNEGNPENPGTSPQDRENIGTYRPKEKGSGLEDRTDNPQNREKPPAGLGGREESSQTDAGQDTRTLGQVARDTIRNAPRKAAEAFSERVQSSKFAQAANKGYDKMNQIGYYTGRANYDNFQNFKAGGRPNNFYSKVTHSKSEEATLQKAFQETKPMPVKPNRKERRS